MSQHAIKRSQQRGIPEDAIAALIAHGTRQYSRDGISHTMDRESRKRAKAAMGESAYKKIERWFDCYVVTSTDSAQVITAAWRIKKWRR